MCSGTLIVDGVIQNVPCKFTIDTVADVTTLCSRLYDVPQRGKLKDVADDETLKGLDELKISVVVKITVQMGLGEEKSYRQCGLYKYEKTALCVRIF